MNTYIYECSHNNASTIKSTSNWETTFSHGIPIETGDQISIKNVFLNSQEKQNDNRIVVTKDESEISLQIGYYEYCDNDGISRVNASGQELVVNPPDIGTVHIDFKPKIAYLEGTNTAGYYNLTGFYVHYAENGTSVFNDVIKQVEFFVSFTPIPNTPNTKFVVLHTNIPINITQFTKEGEFELTLDNPITMYGKLFDITQFTVIGSQTGEAKKLNFTPNNDPINFPSSFTNYITEHSIFYEYVKFKIPEGSYEPEELCKIVSDKLTTRKILNYDSVYASHNLIMPLVGGNIRFFPVGFAPSRDVSGLDNNYYKYKTPLQYFMGASQCVLTFNEETNSFGFSYLHTPIIHNKIISIKDIAIEKGTPKTKYYDTVPQQCGIFVMDCFPKSFWFDKLGFNNDNLVMPLKAGTATHLTYIENQSIFENHITLGFASLQTLLDNDNGGREAKLTSNPRYSSTNNLTISLDGVSLQNTPQYNTGYYLVDVNGYPQAGGFYNKDDTLGVKAVVSKQYSNNSFITGFSDSGIPYVHFGQPFILKKINIRILDQGTNKETEDLASNSCVIIQVDKPILALEENKKSV